MKKRIFSIFCVLCLVLTMLPATAWAVEEGVQYLYYNPENGQMETGTYSGQYTTTSLGYGTTLGSAGTETWYVADGNGSSIGTPIPVYGDVRLILAAGSNILLADSSLNITDGSSLTIYGQDSSSGRLSLTPKSGSPITLGSGSSLTIHSGSLTLQTMSATGISVGSGTLTIYGGSVSISTRSDPGISVSSGGTLNIYGGTLTSRGIYSSTGSITGEAGSSININGNAVITGNISGADNDDSWNAIINSTVYGTVTLPDSLKTGLNRYLTVPDGAELILPNGTSIPTSGTITVESGGTLTVEEGSTVYNNSTITVNEGGTFSGGGTLVNQSNGTFSSDGDTSGVTILYEPTVTVTSQSNKDTNVADKNEENVIFTATVSNRVGTPTGSVQFKKGDTNLGDPATLNDGTATCTVSASTLGLGDHSITAVYTPAGGSSYTGKTGALTFSVVGDVTGITVTSQPTKTEYKTGDNLDLTGLEITVSYEGSDTYKPVLSWGAEGITASPDNGTVLQSSAHSGKAVTITYEGKTATTATLAVYETPQQTDGVYQIGTAGELFWFAALVNGTLTDGTEQNTAANAVLTADIDLGVREWTPIAPSATFRSNATSVAETTDKSYSGTFDGQGHTISNFEIRTNSAELTSGLFGAVTGTIENLGVVNARFDNGGDYDGRFGALCGLLVADDDTKTAATIQNCYVVNSSIEATGRIAGAVCGANYSGTIANCYECGNKVSGHSRIGHLVGDNQNDYTAASWLTLKGTVTNCYSDTKLAGTQGGTVNGGGVKDAGAFASGAVAYLLNGETATPAEGETLAWYQNLDNGQTVDSYPVLDSSHGIVYCIIEEKPARYSNNPDATTEPTDISSATVTLSGGPFTYNGTAQKPTVTVTLDDKNLVVDTDYEVSYDPTEVKDAGTYTVTVTGKGNYSGTATGSFTIAKATLTVTGVTAQGRAYDGSATVTITGVTLGGVIDNDDVSVDTSGLTGTVDSPDVGTYNTLTLSGTVTLTGAAAGNYTLTLPTVGMTVTNVNDGSGVTISQATASISFNNYAPGKTYDGTALAVPDESQLTISGAEYNNVTFTWYKGTSPDGAKLDSAPTDAGTYYLVAFIPDSNNTSASEATSGEITITKATATAAHGALSVSNNVAKTYTYDLSQLLPALDDGKTLGEVTYTLGTVSLGSYYTNGATISGSTLTLPIQAVDSSEEKEIGTVTVTISSGNYADMTGTITVSSVNKLPQTVTISGQPGSVVYGDSFTLSASAPGSGAVSWSASGCAEVDSTGKVTVNGTGTFTVTATVAEDNTYAAASNSVTMTAGKKTLTITADSKSAYVGDSAPALTYTVTGLVGSDTLTTAPTLSYASTPDMSKAGEVQILISGAEAGDNYDIQYVNGTLTVTTRPTYLVTVNGGTGGGSYEAGATVTVTAGTRSGYTFQSWTTTSVELTDPTNASVSFTMPANDVTLTANWTANSTGGGSTGSGSSGGGSSSSGSQTETTTNPDGSTTTTVTSSNGTVTETTKFPDGSKEVIETKKDGTVTTTTTDTTGNKTQVVENTDGSSKTTVDNKDGSGSVTLVDENGQVVSEATLSQSAVAAAQEKGEAVALPMPEVPVTTDQENAPTVTVDLPGGGSAKVEIPVEDVTPGTVAVIVKADGTEEVIKTSLTTENGVAVTLSDGDTVKVVDNSKTFEDVPATYWGAEAVDFATSRELFVGTSETTFAPDTAMTRAMIVTVLARFEGVDTTTGSTWYEAGQQWAMQNGVSDGSNMDASLTREQLVTMFYRYAQSKGYDTTQGGMAIREYADFEQISDYAAEAMTWAVNTGIINGTSSTTISPQGPATRAQVATILMRFIEGMA